MDLSYFSEYIPRRKSVRRYNDRPVTEELIEELVDFLSGLEPPQGGIDWNFDTLPYSDMLSISSMEPGVKAPYYLVLRAERKNFSLQNSGYIGEMAALWLCSRGLGSCWQGSIRVTADFPDTLPYVIALAFGYTDEPWRTDLEGIRRKSIKRMTIGDFSGPKREIAEAVRLAPSSMNSQPVSLLSRGNKIHIFRKYVLFKNPVLSYMQCIDAGVAMAHIHVAASKYYNVVFGQQIPEPEWGLKIYQSTVALEEK
ncbi:MAG: nitroreductase family protein [Oscillospiraceae bacterium]|jgi:nitroreductase